MFFYISSAMIGSSPFTNAFLPNALLKVNKIQRHLKCSSLSLPVHMPVKLYIFHSIVIKGILPVSDNSKT
jgi:hypothetical protein